MKTTRHLTRGRKRLAIASLLFCICMTIANAQTTVIANDTLKIQGRSGSSLTIVPDTASVVLSTKGSRPLIFRTDSIESMRISSSGRFGLGTSSPQELFEIRNGNILVSRSSGSPGKILLQGRNDTYVGIRADSVSANVTYTLPSSRPTTNGQVLTSDTNGVLSWGGSSTSTVASANHGYQTFTQTTTFQVPSGINQLYVQLWGGGGGGGSDRCGLPGGGGGSGGYVSATVAVVAGEQLELIVGAGGAPDVTNGGCNCGCDPSGLAGQITSIRRLSSGTIILSATAGSGGGGACRNGPTGPGAVCAIGTGPGGGGSGGSFLYTRGMGVFLSTSTNGNSGTGAAGGAAVCVSGACYGAGGNNMVAGAPGAIAIDW